MCNVTGTGVYTLQCNSDTTHAEVKLRPECPRKVTVNDNACRAGTLSQLTLRLTAQTAMSTTNWIIEVCALWVPSTSSDDPNDRQ